MNEDKILILKQRVFAFLLAITMPLTLSKCSKDKNISNKEIKEYISFFTTINSVYNCEKIYPTMEDTIETINKSKITTKCELNYDSDEKTIISQIKENSLKYLQQHPEYSSAFITEETPALYDDQKYFETSLETIITSLLANATNDIGEDICNLSNLCIVFSYDDFNATNKIITGYYNQTENTIIIFPNRVRFCSNASSIDYLTFFEKNLQHEINHVRQHICSCREKMGQLKQNISTNENYSSILMESSAESELYNISNDYNQVHEFTYEIERKEESLILLLGLFHDDVTINDYYDAIFDSNLKEFYEFCGTKTVEEIHKLHKIIYSMDAHCGKNELRYLVEENGKIDSTKLHQLIGYDYRVDIFSKVLKNMTIYTIEHDFELKDNLVMLNIIKNLIVNNTSNYIESPNSDGYEEYYDFSFSKNIYDLENKYIEFLSKYYNISIDEIRNMETDEIKEITNTIINSSVTYENDIESIISKFPLLKPILLANSFNAYEYDTFVEVNGFAFIKTIK